MNSINPMMSARMVSPAAPPSVMSRRGSLGRVVGRLECLVVLAGWMMAAAAWGDGDQPTSAAPVANNHSDRPAEADAEQGRSKAKVGRRIFSDLRLSRPVGIGCISCHDPRTAFADPRVVSPGAVPGRVGTRNAPTLMYAALIPSFAYEDLLTEEGEEIYVWEGGLFHDGRAQDQFEQVQQPFFHANEMNLPNRAVLAGRLRKAKYADEFRKSVGAAAWADDEQLNYHAYRALVEFLKEPLFRPFDARIDDYLKGKKEALNESEKRGLEVFKNAGKCADCHLLAARSWSQPLLSDFGYDNLGAPSRGKKDPGLGGHTGNAEELGQFRAPTLRNIELTAPYLHNGSIASLREVVEFYNKRDLEPKRWGATDYPATVNHDDLGDLGLSDQQVDDLVALMSAFTDRSLLSEKVKAGRAFTQAPPGVPSTRRMKLHFPDWTHRLHPAFPRSSEPPE
ncbi:MAG: cytochrome c peroxidase [Akkermansiaceae bacterium]